MKKYISGALTALLMTTAVQAEKLEYFLENGVTYDQSVLKPDGFLGHGIGELPTRHDVFVDYIRRVAEASPRMTIETIGYSHERRPIVTLIITSPENHKRLEEIRANHLLRSNPETAKQAKDDMPVVTWLNYGVHGAEASGMEAALPSVYHLAAAQDEKTKKSLEDSVIVLTAVFNPDGHSRRAGWVLQYSSKKVNTNGAHEIHNHAWPGGRTNHYLFDLNRQWLLQTQPESVAWLKQWHKWKPQVSSDFHEMGRQSTYYFHPGVPTRKFPLVPDEAREIAYEIAGYHAQKLDGHKELYFTEEGFDNFYVGKGSTYPQVNGGIGFLFEAGAQMGLAVESRQGVKTYARNIRTQFRTTLSTIHTAAMMKDKLHDYQENFYLNADQEAAKDPIKGYVFKAPKDPARMDMFLTLLKRHKIMAYSVQKNVKAEGKIYEAGHSYIVPLRQSQYRMIKSMFGKFTNFPDNVFYDVSGWTMPLAYGLEFAEVKSSLRSVIGEHAEKASQNAAVPEVAPYAYVFRWSDYYAPRALNRILEKGIMARVAKNPIRVKTTKGVVSFDRGAIIVSMDRQTVSDADIHAAMVEVAAEDNLTVHSATSGRTLDAGTDLGGRDTVSDLSLPKPLLIVGSGVSVYDAGEVWHQLDHRMKMNVTLVRRDNLRRVDWHDFTHVILVGGRGTSSPFTKPQEAALKDWIRQGGTVIAQRGHAQWAAKELLGLKHKKSTEKKENRRLAYSVKGQEDAKHVVGGAIFKSAIDTSHPLGFGHGNGEVNSHRNTAYTLPVPTDAYAKVAVYAKAPLQSGYTSEKRLKEIAGTPMIVAQRMGGGSVILFADNPNFRATFIGTNKLFMNALFFSKAFAAEGRRGEEGHSH
ncbi:M14 family zinc carboxypeptidase [Temperatibacter marinus]|uniref:M14 family zinc carboxypeptidase n=1 Tax=Temperatibacter marinus TaxID=1456591 RepID=A0AA52H7X1_9PROT|nr:M14 family zinc carboxypeptidase [Temperatibacter marinus]WND01521.1 M14 family zinc carboxypeptidase [Temperatibacter marinus]